LAFGPSIAASGALSIAGAPPTTVAAGNAYSFTPTVAAPAGVALTFAIKNKPAWASFNSANGTLSGTPSSASVGRYGGISISVHDGLGGASLAHFAITVTGTVAPPTISGTPATSVMVGNAYSFTPSASSPRAGATLTFSIANQPAWASFSTATGRLSGTPVATSVGTYSNVVIKVSDGTASASLPAFSLTVTPSSAPPSISGAPAASVMVGTMYSFTPAASSPRAGATLAFSITNQPAWASFNATTGKLSGIPGPASVGSYANIVVTVSDGTASASLAAFTVTVTPSTAPPTIAGTPATTAMAGTAYSFTPAASSPRAGATLTYSITNQPSWATFSASTGTLSGTPAASNVGSFAGIVITVNDGTLAASLPAFTITVAPSNAPPSISGTPATSVSVGNTYSFTPTASSPRAGATLSYSITNQPSWASFSTTSGKLSGAPAATNVGSFAGITITVSDGTLSATLPAFTITVTPSTAPPTIGGTPPTSVMAGTAYAFTPTASSPRAGATLSYSITNQPSWATFSTSTGKLSGTPAATNVGSFAGVVITVNDGTLSASLPAFSITVTASTAPPTISGTPATSVTAGSAYSFTPVASSPRAGATFTFTISGVPSWATFSATTGRLSGTPTTANIGTYANVVISVSDGTLSASLAAFTITVQPGTSGAVTVTWSPPTTRTDGTSLTNLAGYYLYYGTTQGSYPNKITIAGTSLTSYTVSSLASGTYYLVMSAYDATGMESQQTSVVASTVP
jgi:hypothetical protein